MYTRIDSARLRAKSLTYSRPGAPACAWAAAGGLAYRSGSDPAGERAGRGKPGRAGMDVRQVLGSLILRSSVRGPTKAIAAQVVQEEEIQGALRDMLDPKMGIDISC
ncbi:MAG: hypothetical protein PHS80_05285 [Methanothrix sp.]|nr:hypothetical protein [Methanothrix sp.]MDD4449048.1 hypothetical protein [Methanothrix sp.]